MQSLTLPLPRYRYPPLMPPRPAALLLALLPGCFLFEPIGPPPLQPAPLDPAAPAAQTASPATTSPPPLTADRDGDGIPDHRDRCPDAPEDKDSFQDDDGCPDPDNDGDGLVDRCDRCPDLPETHNGFQDDDGCPDQPRVLLDQQYIRIVQHVSFERQHVQILASNNPLLDELARVMKDHPELDRVACLGHASSDETNPEVLAIRRAQEVFTALVSRGVPSSRLLPLSAGARRPLESGTSGRARERNRRVEFHILTIRGEDVRRWNGSDLEQVPPPVPAPLPPLPGCD